ncbi:MAG: class IV adenylate cyclase [Anaerolineales bacterium]|nr:class IV adenylate cyclase [Anaerolineales bacterium]
MSTHEEIEVKFFVHDLAAVKTHLQAQGAPLLQERTLEVNLRFDLPDGSLCRAHRVLRLRRDTRIRLTYKGPGELRCGVCARQEIEFAVEDFAQARALLESLGYQVVILYEKYRCEYRFGETQIALDEMPFGSFVEIEGPHPAAIRAAARNLKLEWTHRISASYLDLYDRLKARRGLAFRDLTFENFAGLDTGPADLGIRAADFSSSSA